MRIRPGGARDVATFTRLINAQYQWLRGEDLWQEDELAATLISASGDPIDNDRYLEIDGEAVAAVHVHMSEPYTKGTLTLAVPPRRQRDEIVQQLLGAGERIVRSHPVIAAGAPVDVLLPREDTALIDVAQRCGYRVLQKITTLEADVFDAPAARLPPNLTLSTLSIPSDLEDGYEVIRQTFPPELGAWHMSRRDYEYCMRNDPTALPGLSLIARDAEGPVALALNFLDTMQPLSGLIAALGVLPRRRRQGIGAAMTYESYDRFRSRGWLHARMATVLGMGVDDNDYSFYSAVGMKPVFDDLVLVKE
ncbi:MAG: GNAT family N-acetyltransferase [Actinomycetes bacterium]